MIVTINPPTLFDWELKQFDWELKHEYIFFAETNTLAFFAKPCTLAFRPIGDLT
jgi:hypothetical protein